MRRQRRREGLRSWKARVVTGSVKMSGPHQLYVCAEQVLPHNENPAVYQALILIFSFLFQYWDQEGWNFTIPQKKGEKHRAFWTGSCWAKNIFLLLFWDLIVYLFICLFCFVMLCSCAIGIQYLKYEQPPLLVIHAINFVAVSFCQTG